jgi:hypothetical protein
MSLIKKKEDGMTMLTVTSSISLVFILLIGAVYAASRVGWQMITAQLAVTSGLAEARATMAKGAWFLADRLQRTPSLILDELGAVPGLTIQDEGGKVSLPDMAYVLPAVLPSVSLGIGDDHVSLEPPFDLGGRKITV